MIQIAGSNFDSNTLMNQYPPYRVERKILLMLSSSPEIYRYPSEEVLAFEVDLRKNIIRASVELAQTHFSFAIFRKSRCNTDYWERTEEGGFLLKNNVTPFDAILDIYRSSRKYATECATAMVIVFYRALAATFSRDYFNQAFPKIYLMNWQHLDPSLGIQYFRRVSDHLPGDCRYFKNPDVDPETPEWQGENTIDLGDGSFYGHGVGIRSEEGVIMVLNKFRIKGSDTSAYLMDSATRPDFVSLGSKYYTSGSRNTMENDATFLHPENEHVQNFDVL